jgi:HK97 family phage prohead protease
MPTSPNPRAAVTGRETRMFTVQPVELRKDAEGGATGLAGYASVTDSPYAVTDWLGEYTEVIRAGAFKRTLDHQDDVRLLLNHEGLPLARTKSGTLTLSEVTDPSADPQEREQTGLWVEADLDPQSGLAKDVKSAMSRGDLDEMSFAFQVVRQEWSPDFTQRDILEVKLFDVSVVTYPANPATSVGLRAADVDRLADDEARELMGRLQARFATQTSEGRDLSLARAQAVSLSTRRTA